MKTVTEEIREIAEEDLDMVLLALECTRLPQYNNAPLDEIVLKAIQALKEYTEF